MKRDSFLLRLLLEWVLICAGVLCSLYCLTTAFSLTMPTAVLILVPILALAFCLLFNGKVGKFYALGVLGSEQSQRPYSAISIENSFFLLVMLFFLIVKQIFAQCLINFFQPFHIDLEERSGRDVEIQAANGLYNMV